MAKKQGNLTSAAKALGSAGGKVGGPARARKLTKARRTEIARQGGKARQKGRKEGSK